MIDVNEVNRIIKEHLTDQFCEGYVEVGNEGTCMPKYYKDYEESIKNFKVKNDDIWVASYPKAGTTWTQEMVWLIANNLDFKGAEVMLEERFPFLEICTLYDFEKLEKTIPDQKPPQFIKNSVEYVNNKKSPRFIKTHLPFCLLPQDVQNKTVSPKIIYVFRNPKDICVSYYHHGKILQGWTGDIKNFSKAFLAEKVMYGSFWKHLLGYWNHKDSHNLLLITYEDMKRDLKSIIQKVAKFLNKSYTDDQIQLLMKHLDFNSMKSNKAVNKQNAVEGRKRNHLANEDGTFMRSGTVGKYKEELTPEIISAFNEYTKKYIAGTDFEKQYSYIF